MERFRYAVRAGVKIGAGTDVIADLFDELQMLTWGGMTAMQAIEAATRVNADILGKGDELGTVTPGKLADIIVVDADPLADIQNIRKVSWVMKAGRAYDPAALSEAAGKDLPLILEPAPNVTRGFTGLRGAAAGGRNAPAGGY